MAREVDPLSFEPLKLLSFQADRRSRPSVPSLRPPSAPHNIHASSECIRLRCALLSRKGQSPAAPRARCRCQVAVCFRQRCGRDGGWRKSP